MAQATPSDRQQDAIAAPLLALYGLPPALSEPVVMLAEILGWQVAVRGFGPSLPAQLCLALAPAAANEPPDALPLLAWSPDNILNELISAQGLSIMEQPPCVNRLETLLQATGRHPGLAS
jgi:hypothetical protein